MMMSEVEPSSHPLIKSVAVALSSKNQSRMKFFKFQVSKWFEFDSLTGPRHEED